MFNEAWLSKRGWGKFVYVLLWAGVFVLTLYGVSERYLFGRGYRVEDPLNANCGIEYDAYLGWRPFSPDGVIRRDNGTICVNEGVWPDSSRKSRPQRFKKASKRVLLLGCSHTYGFAVPDNETFAWFLNERFPDIAFDNFAVSGYGTYQCYLREKQQLMLHPEYDLVLYCSFNDHLRRNVIWTHHIISGPGFPSGLVSPVVDLDQQGRLRFYDVQRHWPGDDFIISVNYAKNVYYRWWCQRSVLENNLMDDKNVQVFSALILKMEAEAKRHGSKFGMVWLFNIDEALERFMQVSNNLIDCYPHAKGERLGKKERSLPVLTVHSEEFKNPECLVPGENGHFNVIIQRFWAQQIGDWLEEWWLKGK